MQSALRPDSRRRAHTPEPSRRRRTPSAAEPIALSPRFRHLPSLLHALSHFAAVAPNISPLLFAFIAVSQALALALLTRPSSHALRLAFRGPYLPLLSAIHLTHLLTALLAVRLVGPIRALVPLGAHPTIAFLISSHPPPRRRRSFPCIILTLLALVLLSYDASRISPAVHMRDRVLRTSAARAVHTKFQTISHHINIHAIPFRYHQNTVESNALEEALPETFAQHAKPPVHPKTPKDTHSKHDDTNTRNLRRRLMAIVHGSQLNDVLTEKPLAAANPQNSQNVSRNEPAVNKSKSFPSALQDKAVKEDTTAQMKPGTATSAGNREPLSSPASLSVPLHHAALGVIMAAISSVSGRIGSEMRSRVMNDADECAAVSVALFSSCSFVLFVILGSAVVADTLRGRPVTASLHPDAALRGLCLSLTWFLLPMLVQVHNRGILQARSHRSSKGSNVHGFLALSSSLLKISANSPTVTSFYFVAICVSTVMRWAKFVAPSDSTGALSYMAGLLMVFSSKIALSASEITSSRHRVMNASHGDLSVYLGKSVTTHVRGIYHSIRASVSASFKGIKDIAVHARSNKASWQVLNFLILQSCMAVVEVIYATITNSSGLFSISADNFFCCIALAIGLIAIRISARNKSETFTYGFGRIESLCGFANGIILIYVGVLIVLEASERQNEDVAVAVGRAFSVCCLGLLGNILGLYFFPPESRRENHNVQGIYLHIWANTFAFARIAISTALISAVPRWKSIDIATAAVVGTGMIACAIPLVLRSARLLLLLPMTEKKTSLISMQSQLGKLSGVIEVHALRIWNLTPNFLVASVRLVVSDKYEGSDAEILSRAREIFADMKIDSSDCTIQITRSDGKARDSVVYLHKRSRSALPDTGINVDMLSGSSRQKQEPGEANSSPALGTL